MRIFVEYYRSLSQSQVSRGYSQRRETGKLLYRLVPDNQFRKNRCYEYLKNPKILLVLPIMFLGAIFAIPAIHPAYGLTGTVCLADPSLTACPATASAFGGAVGSTLRVAVLISGSDPLNGFDVQILADRSILQATDADLTGTILGAGATVIAKCIDGVLKAGASCAAQDGPGVLHLAATKTGANVAGNGLLFTGVYNVVGKTPSMNIAFNTGCPGTSIPNVCVTISNGTTTPNAEAALGATFANSQDFTLSVSPNPLSLTPGTSGTLTVTATSQGGFSDVVGLTASASGGLPVSPASSSIDLTVATTGTATFTVGPGATGTYTVTFTGTSTFSAVVITHTVTATVNIAPVGFTVSANPSSLSIPPGGSGTSTITVTAVSGFTGVVVLSATSPAGISTSFNPPTVTNSGTSILTITVAASVAPGSYIITVKGTSGTTTATTTITVSVGTPDFTIISIPTGILIYRGFQGASSINVTSVNNFAGTVTMTVSVVVHGTDSPGNTAIRTSLDPSSVTLTAGSTKSSVLGIFTAKSDATGNYTATVTGRSGSITHTATLDFSIADFTMSVQYPVLTITNQTGIKTENDVTVHSLGGFANQLAAGSPGEPARGRLVPELHAKFCLMEVYYANGTKVPMATVALNGPISVAGPTSGCRGDANPAPFPGPGGDDMFTTFTQPLSHTALGTYTIRLYANAGALVNTIDFKLVVIQGAQVSGLHWTHSVSVSRSPTATFTVTVYNPNSVPLYVQVVIHGISDTGTRSFTEVSAILLVPAHGTATFTLTHRFVLADAGHTFSFTVTLRQGTVATALTATSNGISNIGIEDFDDSNQNAGIITVTA